MYLRDLLVGLRRRWYVALLGLLATAALAVVAVRMVPVTYTATTSILLLPPQPAVGPKGNPYLNLAGLSQALEVLSTRVDASDATQAVLGAHPTVTATVGPDPTTTGPILLISSTADSPQESMEVRDQLSGIVPDVLVTMQNDIGVRQVSRITASPLASDRRPTKEIKDQLRAVIAIVAAGSAGSFLVTGYLDFLLAVRSGTAVRRRIRAPKPVPVWETAPATVAATTSAAPDAYPSGNGGQPA
jgi:hypothetical protein